MSGARSLTPEQSNHVREAIRTLWRKFGTQAVVARELGVSQQTISAVLGGGDAGVTLAAATARAMHLTYEELVKGLPPRASSVPRYSLLPGWDDAVDKARLTRRAPDFALAAVGTLSVAVRPEAVTPEFVIRLALFWLENAPLSERINAERALLPIRWRSSGRRSKRRSGGR